MLNVRYNPQDILKSSKIQTCSIPGSRCKAHILYIYQWLHICVDIYLKTSVFSVLKDIKCDFNALILNFYTPPPPPPYSCGFIENVRVTFYYFYFVSPPPQIWATSPLRCRRKCTRSICPGMASNISGPNSFFCPKTSRRSTSAATTCSK